jgi:hypothetical protein
MPERDENEQAVRNVEKATDSEEKLFWKQLRADRSKQLREKRDRYGLRTIREAELYCPPPPPSKPRRTTTRPRGSKIIPFRQAVRV